MRCSWKHWIILWLSKFFESNGSTVIIIVAIHYWLCGRKVAEWLAIKAAPLSIVFNTTGYFLVCISGNVITKLWCIGRSNRIEFVGIHVHILSVCECERAVRFERLGVLLEVRSVFWRNACRTPWSARWKVAAAGRAGSGVPLRTHCLGSVWVRFHVRTRACASMYWQSPMRSTGVDRPPNPRTQISTRCRKPVHWDFCKKKRRKVCPSAVEPGLFRTDGEDANIRLDPLSDFVTRV